MELQEWLWPFAFAGVSAVSYRNIHSCFAVTAACGKESVWTRYKSVDSVARQRPLQDLDSLPVDPKAAFDSLSEMALPSLLFVDAGSIGLVRVFGFGHVSDGFWWRLIKI